MCNTCGCKGAETFEATDVGKRMKCRGCSQWEFVRGVPMNNFLQDDNGKWRCYNCLYDNPKHKVVIIGRGKHKPFVAETFEAEGGRVRTMSGKPHTPRKLRKDQNIKPEEARMRKQMKAETFEAKSKGKSKCSKHYWDLAVRRNPISGERQFFNQCLLCGKKNFSRGGSAMSDRGFFAEDLKMESYCGRCDKRTEISRYPHGAIFCVCGRGKSIIVDGYEIGRGITPQYIKDFLRSKGKRDYGTPRRRNRTDYNRVQEAESKFDELADEIAEQYEKKGKSKEEAEKIGKATAYKVGVAKYGKRGMTNKAKAGMRKKKMGAESYQVREGFDTCETCGDSPLFVSTQIAGGTYCMDCASRVWRAEGGSKCEGKKLKDSGYCDLDFDYSSSGLYAKCSDCGNEEFQDEYWDSRRISYTEPDEGQVLCAVKEGGSEDDLGYCSFDWGWGSGYAYADCDVCGTQVEATLNNQFYDDDDEDFRAESPFKSDAFNEGRSAGITMFIPEGDAEDYYSNLDTEYMIFYGLSPEDLAKDIDGNSKRYLQFVAGWDDGWNYATLLHEGVLADDSDSEGDLEDLDYEMAGEWIYKDYPKGVQEYVPSPKELGVEVAVIGGIVALGLGYFAFKDKIGLKK